MPKVEVDEAEILEARRLKGVLAAITADPKRKARLEMLHKEVDPNVPTPTTDLLKPVDDAVSAVSKQIADLTKQLADEKAESEKQRNLAQLSARVDSGLASLKQQGWMDDGIAKVKAIMEEKGLLDVDDAVAIFERRNPPPPPIAPGGSGAWNFMDDVTNDADADIKKMIETKGNSEPLINSMVNKTLAEIRGSSRR
jgi:ribosome assembly protein YihI (activator of Der GTPase)